MTTQPIGEPVPNWTPPQSPSDAPMLGRYCRLEHLDPEKHAQELFESNSLDEADSLWTYLFHGPFQDFESYKAWVKQASDSKDPLFFAIVDLKTQMAVGVASFMRIDEKNGVVEVGGLCFSPLLQRTVAATEAMYLMMERAFTMGYRRYEWKCNALNQPSRNAAMRLGFSYEGLFRQAVVVKGRNRDTAWYSVIDLEWPKLQEAFLTWLDPANFNAAGEQLVSLSKLTEPLLAQTG